MREIEREKLSIEYKCPPIGARRINIIIHATEYSNRTRHQRSIGKLDSPFNLDVFYSRSPSATGHDLHSQHTAKDDVEEAGNVSRSPLLAAHSSLSQSVSDGTRDPRGLPR